MATRLEEIESDLALYEGARRKILEGAQSYSTKNGISLTRANLSEIEANIKSLRAERDSINAGSNSGVFFMNMGGFRG